MVKTNLGRDQSAIFKTLWSVYEFFAAKTVEQGAATACYAAVHPALEGVTGQFLTDCDVVSVSGEHHMEDYVLAQKLWDYTESLLDGYLLS